MECKHGLDVRWCAVCKHQVEVETKPSSFPQCCSPSCGKASSVQVGSLPLCLDHYHRLESQVAKVYTNFPYNYGLEKSDLLPYYEPGDWVYFVKIDDVIKIGFSINPRNRIRSFASYGHSVQILALEGGDISLEKRLHRKFADYRASVGFSRELFEPHPVLLEYIKNGRHCAHCNRLVEPHRVICERHLKHSDEVKNIEEMFGVQLDTRTTNSQVLANETTIV